MQITKTPVDGGLNVAVDGRLDGYWAADLDNALSEAVRDGHHHLCLDLAQVTFLSSAGIATLLKTYKQLARIDGSCVVVNPSPAVRLVLDTSGLSAMFSGKGRPATAPVASPEIRRRVEHPGVVFDVFDKPAASGLRCEVIGSDAPLARAAFAETDSVSLGSRSPVFALGVGAFGDSFADCRARFGEMVSVAGATGYQPADGTNVADYLMAKDALPNDVRLLYGLACTGEFTRHAHFECQPAGGAVGMVSLLEGIQAVVDAPAVGFVMVSETAGLVGAALRRSPAQPLGSGEDDGFFAHPGVRGRLAFTAERAFLRSTTVTVGVVMKAEAATRAACVRPIGKGGLVGHVHAAAFPFRPLRKGEISLKDTVTSLFESEQLLGVLHLLHDDRGPAGAGESEFIRGACWAGPILPPVGA
jgi:anti-anti-sigma factor